MFKKWFTGNSKLFPTISTFSSGFYHYSDFRNFRNFRISVTYHYSDFRKHFSSYKEKKFCSCRILRYLISDVILKTLLYIMEMFANFILQTYNLLNTGKIIKKKSYTCTTLQKINHTLFLAQHDKKMSMVLFFYF